MNIAEQHIKITKLADELESFLQTIIEGIGIKAEIERENELNAEDTIYISINKWIGCAIYWNETKEDTVKGIIFNIEIWETQYNYPHAPDDIIETFVCKYSDIRLTAQKMIMIFVECRIKDICDSIAESKVYDEKGLENNLHN